MKKTILVAGGAGFIGSYVCDFLLKKNDHVICLDNQLSGNKRNISEFLKNPHFQFIQGDIKDSKTIKKLYDIQFDEIYHLASPATVTYVVDNPVEVAKINSIGTINLLDLAHHKKSKILFASSSESYGDPKEHPQKETYWGNVNPVGVRSGYDEGKRFGEAISMAYHRQHKLDVKIIRIFNTYGPNSSVHDTRVVPKLVMQALRNEPLTVHGDGLQTRSFCFVEDMALGIIAMMESHETGPINLGNPQEYKIIELAKMVISQTKSKSKIIYTERPEDDPNVRKPDISQAKKKLSWKPKVNLNKGLPRTIDYFKIMLRI